MASDDKEYEQSALGKRVNELMDDGYDFGEAVKQAMSEGLKDGGSIGIEVLFGPKREDFNIGGRAKRNTPIDSRASVLDYANALQKVGGGTAAQKSKDLSNYIQSYTPKGAPAALATAAQFAQGILGVDLGTPQTRSMTNFLQKTIQDKIAQSGKLSGSIDYRDYGVQTDAKGQHPYGKGDASFTSPEFALATTLGKGDYSVDPKTGKVTFTGGTAYDFPKGTLPFGLGEFISKGGFFGDKALDYSPNVTLGSDFMKQFNQPQYPDYKTAALQSQYYKNNPSNLDSDLFRAAYARAVPDSGIKTRITNEGQVATDYGNYDPSRVYSAYMSNTGTSSSNPFFDQFKGSQYADMPTIMEAMYGTPGNMNPYYADGGRVGMLSGGLLSKGIMGALEQIKNMDEGNLFSKLDPLGKAKTIKDSLLDRIEGFKEIIKDLKTQGRPIYEIEDMKFEMDEAKNGLEKINEYIKNQPTNRTLQADGGRVGLFMGGDPLTGQALSIYDSMKAYNFSDQEIANALSAQGLYTAGGSGTPETTTPNIIGSQINQGGGGDGIQSIGPQNIASFTETVEARQNRLNKPGKIADFINSNLGKIGINTQRSANEMLASGIKDTRATSGIPFGISGMIARALPNAYTDKLTLGEQVFSQENMGFTGQGNMANKDPFGINVVSAFGNYADYVKDRVAELEDIVADQKKRGLTDTYQMKELAFRSKQDIDRQNRISDAAKIQELQRKEKERIAKANTARQVVMEEARQRGDNPSAGSFSSNSPGGISQQTSRDARGGMSGWGLRDGGLATMFTRRR